MYIASPGTAAALRLVPRTVQVHLLDDLRVR
jgi:hypothetical protein